MGVSSGAEYEALEILRESQRWKGILLLKKNI